MKTKNKLMALTFLATGAASGIALLNKYIKLSATSKNLLSDGQACCFKWRLGQIHYTKIGSGKPILLVHDLNEASSGYEWSQVVNSLKNDYTVYTIDLLGCGRSEKPNLTYTNYLYVQLISDFIKSEVGHRTHIIATGESASIAIMACNTNPELFDQLMLINPLSLLELSQIPSKNGKPYKFILDLPIIGTLLYHISSSRNLIEEKFEEKYFYNLYSIKPIFVDYYFEASHLGQYPKAIFSSIQCNFTKCNITTALKKIDNSIYIVGGKEKENISELIKEYKLYNSAIEYSLIDRTKHLPQLEAPERLLELIKIFFS